MRRITLVISSLSCGGAERVATNMANYWAGRGWSITILTLFHRRTSACYDLAPQIRHINLNIQKQPLRFNPSPESVERVWELAGDLSPIEHAVFVRDFYLAVLLRKAIIETQPCAIISFMDITNVRVLMATRGLNIPVIVSEHSDPRANSMGFEGRAMLRRRLYSEAAFVVTLTEEAHGFFSPFVGHRLRIIPNPVLKPAKSLNGQAKKRAGIIIGMGRLSEEKGLDLLIKAFAKIQERNPEWSLEIWGDGHLRHELESLCDRVGLQKRVRFCGHTSHPYEALQRGDIFVLPSKTEGFPNSLCEAMACGLAPVAFNCSSGVRRIIRNGVDGLLVPPGDVAALARTLEKLMADDVRRKELSKRAVEVVERFQIEKVMSMWEELLPGSATIGLNQPAVQVPSA